MPHPEAEAIYSATQDNLPQAVRLKLNSHRPLGAVQSKEEF